MNIQIGTKLSLKLEGQKSVITAYFVGEKNKQHIVITFPENESADIKKIKRRSVVKAQYSENNAMYEFRSKVTETLDEPVGLIVLEYPAEVYSIEKRAQDRITCLVSAKLKNKSDDELQWSFGVVENINKRGCLCTLSKIKDSRVSFKVDGQVIIKCQFPGLVGEQTTDGKVVRMQGEEKGIILGIHFNEKVWWVPPYEQR